MDMVPGQYEATPEEWGLEYVEKVQTWKAVIKFKIKNQDHSIKWDGFITKRDGDVNKKTVNTLVACGFKEKSVSKLTSPEALDKSSVVLLTVIEEGDYLRVDWVNKPNSIKSATQAELKGYDFSKFDAALNKANQDQGSVSKGAVPNRAPTFDTEEEVPF